MIDRERVTKAVLETECSPLALEEGAGLVQAWIDRYEEDKDDEILAVECGWSVRLDERTWAVGVMDMVAKNEKGVYAAEWKSTRAPSRYWGEEKWLESIRSGPQIAVYALALSQGTFTSREGGIVNWDVFTVKPPVRIRVRACVKTAVPDFWPVNPVDGWCEFGPEALDAVAAGFRARAEQVRASRRLGLVPWQLTGDHCTKWNRQCEYYEECREYRYPEIAVGFDISDPAARLALPYLPDEATRQDAVILSASAYSDYSRCMELGRRKSQGGGKEESLALETGTVLHAGIGEFYRQIRDEQRLSRSRKNSLDTER